MYVIAVIPVPRSSQFASHLAPTLGSTKPEGKLPRLRHDVLPCAHNHELLDRITHDFWSAVKAVPEPQKGWQ